MIKKYTLSFILFAMGVPPLFAQGLNFEKVANTGLQNMTAGDVAIFDANNDGALDILLTGEISVFPPQPSTKLYLNDGSGHFSETTTSFPNVGLGAVGHADIDQDGDEDLFICGTSGSSMPAPVSVLYKNDGTSHFTEVTNTPFPPLYYADMAFADFDNDGNADIVITGASGYANDNPSNPVAEIYINDGNGNFSELTGLGFAGLYNSSVACGDIDNDGDADVLMMGFDENNSPQTYLYANNSDGTFTAVANTIFPGLSQGDAAFLDIDGDNDADLILSGIGQGNSITTNLYRNDGSGHFSLISNASLLPVALSSIGVSDFNADGHPDIILSGIMANSFSAATKLYINEGTGVFSEANTLVFDAVGESATAIGDIDNDGLPDILITGGNDSDMPLTALYQNKSSLSIGQNLSAGNIAMVYPNPTTGILNIKWASSRNDVRITLWSVVGQKVYEKVFSGDAATIDLNNLADGMYLLEINGQEQQKITKRTW